MVSKRSTAHTAVFQIAPAPTTAFKNPCKIQASERNPLYFPSALYCCKNT